MILEEDVYKIGKLGKTHALKGEIAFNFDDDVFDEVDIPYLILKIDGIFVPFFINEYRFKNEDTALISFDDLDSAEKVSRLQGVEVYFPREYAKEKEVDVNTWNYFIDFQVIENKNSKSLGKIVAIDEQTINTLLLIEDDKANETIIPAVEEWFISIDHENKVIKINLPEGLLE